MQIQLWEILSPAHSPYCGKSRKPLNSCFDFSSKWQNSNTILRSCSSVEAITILSNFFSNRIFKCLVLMNFLLDSVEWFHRIRCRAALLYVCAQPAAPIKPHKTFTPKKTTTNFHLSRSPAAALSVHNFRGNKRNYTTTEYVLKADVKKGKENWGCENKVRICKIVQRTHSTQKRRESEACFFSRKMRGRRERVSGTRMNENLSFTIHNCINHMCRVGRRLHTFLCSFTQEKFSPLSFCQYENFTFSMHAHTCPTSPCGRCRC